MGLPTRAETGGSSVGDIDGRVMVHLRFTRGIAMRDESERACGKILSVLEGVKRCQDDRHVLRCVYEAEGRTTSVTGATVMT